MNEFRDLSRLPDDPEYWKALESRVVSGLGETNGAIRGGGTAATAPGWWSPLEAGALSLGATALAALLAALLLLPPRAATQATPMLLLTPADPALLALIVAPSPPSIASLVLPAGGRGSK